MHERNQYKKYLSILLHVLMWVVFSLTFFSRQPLLSGSTVMLAMLVAAFYFNAYVLVPKLLLKNRVALYVIVVCVVVFGITYFSGLAEHMIDNLHLSRISFYELINVNNGGPDVLLGFRNVFTIIMSGLIVGISTAITTIQKWQRDRQEREAMEKEKVTTELSFLKAQINPHFFFNTLNNIYALTAIDAAVAGSAIHQLSRMMRYILYDTQEGSALLSQEIAFIKDYISLMQLRVTDAVTITLDIPPNLQDVAMAPMIFLPFIENAFKHGVSATEKSYIHISLVQHEKQLAITVKNKVIKHNNVSLDTDSAIGLVNTRRRLDLLYSKKYTLDISRPDNGNEYIVQLMLDLS